MTDHVIIVHVTADEGGTTHVIISRIPSLWIRLHVCQHVHLHVHTLDTETRATRSHCLSAVHRAVIGYGYEPPACDDYFCPQHDNNGNAAYPHLYPPQHLVVSYMSPRGAYYIPPGGAPAILGVLFFPGGYKDWIPDVSCQVSCPSCAEHTDIADQLAAMSQLSLISTQLMLMHRSSAYLRCCNCLDPPRLQTSEVYLLVQSLRSTRTSLGQQLHPC